jgi:hypothetical protein
MTQFHGGAFRSLARVAFVVVAAAAALTGCASDPIVAVNEEVHPADLRYIVSATFGPWHNGYYSVAVTIHNETNRTLLIKPAMFRLEGTPPTGFVPADRIPLMMGRAGYRMPLEVEPRCTAQGEIFYGIRGSETPKGKVRFVATLPDGDHSFEFTLVE